MPSQYEIERRLHSVVFRPLVEQFVKDYYIREVGGLSRQQMTKDIMKDLDHVIKATAVVLSMPRRNLDL